MRKIPDCQWQAAEPDIQLVVSLSKISNDRIPSITNRNETAPPMPRATPETFYFLVQWQSLEEILEPFPRQPKISNVLKMYY